MANQNQADRSPWILSFSRALLLYRSRQASTNVDSDVLSFSRNYGHADFMPDSLGDAPSVQGSACASSKSSRTSHFCAAALKAGPMTMKSLKPGTCACTSTWQVVGLEIPLAQCDKGEGRRAVTYSEWQLAKQQSA